MAFIGPPEVRCSTIIESSIRVDCEETYLKSIEDAQ
jgi:hypothetical protein